MWSGFSWLNIGTTGWGFFNMVDSDGQPKVYWLF